MSRRGPVAVVVLATVVLAACGGPRERGPEALAEWPATRELRVGSVDDPGTALTWFRGMEVGPDGRMYTLHPQEERIRVFAADGTPAGTIGGEGEGPGEFSNPAFMGWVADTLWVLDLRGYRFSQFSADGALLGSFQVPFTASGSPDEAGPARANGLLPDGTVHGAPPAFSSLVASGKLTHYVPMLMNREGEVTDTLPAIAFGRSQWAISDPDHPERGGTYTRQPFADGPLWAFAPNERALVIVDREAATDPTQASYRVTKLGFGGDTIFSRAYPYAPEPLPPARADSTFEATMERFSSFRRGGTEGPFRKWAETSFYRPAFLPPLSDMKAGRDGTIWLRMAPEGGQVSWTVLDRDGTPLGRTTLPEALTALVVDACTLWGYELDDLDVTYLVRYRVACDR